MFYAVLAYLLWGSFAAYFPLLQPAQPLEILAHRVLWTAVVMIALLTITKSWRELKQASRGTWGAVVLAAIAIAANWLIYVTVVNSGHVTEAALGYFINPLVNVVLGMLFLGERLRFLQKASVGLAAVAVGVLIVLSGHPPYLGLMLALTFGLYGLIKKQVQLSASASLAAETIVLLPFALAYLAFLQVQHQQTFFSHGTSHMLLLMSSGVVTALPLLLFSKAARLIPLNTIGMLQYMTPTMQMLWAVLIMHEQMEQTRWLGFGIIWVSVAMFMWDIWLQRGTQRSSRGKAARVEKH